jgi:hypothetical protein
MLLLLDSLMLLLLLLDRDMLLLLLNSLLFLLLLDSLMLLLLLHFHVLLLLLLTRLALLLLPCFRLIVHLHRRRHSHVAVGGKRLVDGKTCRTSVIDVGKLSAVGAGIVLVL